MPTAEDITTACVALAQEARERRLELDAGRCIPADLMERAGEAGLYRQMLPVGQGGYGLTPAEWFLNGIEMARHEPSFAWSVTQTSSDLVTFITAGSPAFAEAFLADRGANTACSDISQGALVPDGDGFRFSGRWGFCSGCQGATWLGGEGTIEGSPDGERRFGLVPAERARIEDSWNVVGMIATGSHTVVVEEQWIPAEWTFRIDLPAAIDHGGINVATGNGYWTTASSVSSTQLGTARLALDSAIELLSHKVSKWDDGQMLIEHPALQLELFSAEAAWTAARDGVVAALDALWDEAEDMRRVTLATRLRLLAANAHASEAATSVVDKVAGMVGTSIAPAGSAFAACLRDAHTLGSHIVVGQGMQEHAAKIRFGLIDETLVV
jgi:alkylation response protein AidB-like acyl-CoA dehydrogenase